VVSISDERWVAEPHGGAAVQESVVYGRHTLVLTGELDIAQAEEMAEVVRRVCGNGASSITLDLSGLTFMGSTGLRMVLLARDLCREHGYEFRIVPGPTHVQRLFEISGLSNRLPFVSAA
jgi:anti-sigma B factor antagonist